MHCFKKNDAKSSRTRQKCDGLKKMKLNAKLVEKRVKEISGNMLNVCPHTKKERHNERHCARNFALLLK